MMSNVEVVFFAADPRSVGPGGQAPLLIGRELREIREKVRAARYRDRLHLHENWDAQTDDLVQALRDKRPQVVHFSGHGGSRGLVLFGPDGVNPHHLDAPELGAFFEAFSDRIKVVVLNACLSVPQAEAICEAVGCAIGTPDKISDAAAIAFSAAFYSGIAFGESVQQAFDRARAKLRADHFAQREYPQLLHRRDVNPAEMYLIQAEPAVITHSDPPQLRGSRVARHAAVVATVAALTGGGGYLLYDAFGRDRPLEVDTVMAAAGRAGSMTPDAALAAGVDLHLAGEDSAAFPFFVHAASAKIPEAMAYLGTAYLDGKGTERQPVLGIPLLRGAARAGSVRAMLRLALAYQYGDGVDRHRHHARTWFENAAQLGSAEAMRNLGLLHRDEFLADSGSAPVLRWFEMAADSGSLDALVDLGLIHEEGAIVPRDTAEALGLYTRAANAGLPRAMVVIGKFYQERGEYAQALDWYRKGAEAGSAEAMYRLGAMYQNGLGVPANLEEARRYYGQAAALGSEVARANLQALDDR